MTHLEMSSFKLNGSTWSQSSFCGLWIIIVITLNEKFWHRQFSYTHTHMLYLKRNAFFAYLYRMGLCLAKRSVLFGGDVHVYRIYTWLDILWQHFMEIERSEEICRFSSCNVFSYISSFCLSHTHPYATKHAALVLFTRTHEIRYCLY